MKNLFLKIMVLTGFLSIIGCRNSPDPATWSDKKINKWFGKGEWLNGWTVKPDETINRKEFAVSYFKHKDRWDKAFAFLRDYDLSKLELKRYDIDGNNVYAPVSEYLTKNEEDARYEAHRRYIDIQYVASGKELIGIAPLSLQKDILEPYDELRDIVFMTVTQGVNFSAKPDRFFIFFPGDVHRPGLKDGENSQVRKVVVKVKID
ncbi:MAG: YhcH/YjgK/YiaL family protein [Bacteroidales bacterium]|nr:YhcH/YjgK/YiaL family protein [Bacteroidales bacterium]